VLKKVRGILRKKLKSNDRTKKYWEKAGNKDIESVMEFICDKFDRETFETKKESLIFSQKIKLDKEMRVLDLACGIGRTCRWVAPFVKEYVGVDFIPETIEKAKEYNKEISNAEFHVNDGQSIKIFDDESFDLAYSELAFQHMLKPIQESYIKELRRVLKKGGLFYVQIPRLEYYNDSSYSRTRKETDQLFKEFSIIYENEAPAYYYIRAQKF